MEVLSASREQMGIMGDFFPARLGKGRLVRSSGFFGFASGAIVAVGALMFFQDATGPAVAAQKEVLKLAVIQMGISPELPTNYQKMDTWVEKAAQEGARVVVFPEGAILAGSEDLPKLPSYREKLAALAAEKQIYIIFGESVPGSGSREIQAARVFDPRGKEVFHYVKHYDVPSEKIPGIFAIDRTPASIIICADRWLRTVEELPIQLGAKISFELSANFQEEWVPQLGWYWYVPRAIRNNVWVVFANSASNVDCPGHGHSAVIAPDGSVVAMLPDNREAMLVCDVHPEVATRTEALKRANHPLLRDFWSTGLRMFKAELPQVGTEVPNSSAGRSVTLAATTIVEGMPEIAQAIAEAKSRGVDLLVFPTQSCEPTAVETLQELARRHQIFVAAGIKPSPSQTAMAVVVSPEGKILRQIYPLSAIDSLSAEDSLANRIFSVNGVPAIAMVENDILWTEVIELAAVAGVRILVHLGYSDDHRQDDRERQLQVWAAAASYGMFSAMATNQLAAIWEDLNPRVERRAVIDRRPLTPPPEVEILSPFSANLVRSTQKRDIIWASRSIPPTPTYLQDRVARHPALRAWLLWGTRTLLAD